MTSLAPWFIVALNICSVSELCRIFAEGNTSCPVNRKVRSVGCPLRPHQ